VKAKKCKSLASFSPTSILYGSALTNIHFFNSLASTTHFSMAQIPSNMDMSIDYDIIRGRSALSSKSDSRSSSISSSTSLVPYYKHMEMNNNLPDFNIWNPIDSS